MDRLVVGPDEGDAFWVGGHKITIQAGAAETDERWHTESVAGPPVSAD